MALAQQTTGDILGTVTDATNAVVSGAAVTVESLDTHEAHKTTTTGAGEFVVNLLKPGTYSVTITATGFQKFVVRTVSLAAGDRTRVNAQMTVGSTSQTVTVQDVASALQTDSSVLATDIGQQPTQDLPLNGRNYTQLIQLQPGVNEGTSTGGLISGAELDDQRPSASFQANGQSEVMNNQMIDGADNYERLIGSISVRPSVDAISEMNVQTNTYTAEVGRTGGAVVNIITKSGTDQFHGDLFEFFRNDIFNTHGFDFTLPGAKAAPKGEWRQNQFGGSLGGPILKDKAFFFGSYEGYRLIQGTAPTTSIVPTASEYNDIHNYASGGGIDFSDNGGPKLTHAQLDPAGVDYLLMYPAPNSGTNSYVAGSKKIQNSAVYDARLDYTFNTNNIMYARYIYNAVYTDNNGNFPKVTVAGVSLWPEGFSYANDDDWDLLLNYIHTFNPHAVLELKAAYTRSDNESMPTSEGLNPNTAFGQPGINTNIYDSDASGLAIASVVMGTGTSGVVFMPLKDQDNTYQYLGALTLTHGAHNIKIGASSIRRQLTSVQSSFPEALWVFFDYPSLAQGMFLSNVGRSLELDAPHLRVWEPSAYVQDDWHARKNLTLNVGLRYDLFTPYTEIQNRISTWDPATSSLLIAGQNGVSGTAGIQTDYHGLSPRIGFAYSPGRHFVLRGGFGLSYFPMNTTSDANMKDPPFVATTNACASPGSWWGGPYCAAGYQRFINGLPLPTPANINNAGATIPDAVSPHYRTSYAEQFNLTVQKDWKGNVMTVSYVGLLGREMAQLLSDLNAAPPANYNASSDPNAFQEARPNYAKYPNLGAIGYFQSGGNSSYNALETSFERRMKDGLYFNVNYTHEHGLDNSTGLSQEGAGGYGMVPSKVDSLDYGNSPIDFRDHMAATVAYTLPFGKSATGALAMLIKGWQGNFIQVWTSGQPFTVINSSCVSQAISGCDDRSNQIGSWKISNPSISKFFNASAFAQQTAGTLGSERRNQLFGPHFRHSDLSVFKTFPIHESANAEFRVESFNLTNTANWNLPNASLGGANFGAITSMTYAYNPRVLQFALKLNF
jgi:hypothetical protein